MIEHSHTEILKDILRNRPDHAYILSDGSGLVSLAGPDLNAILVIPAPVGVDFGKISDAKVNEYLVEILRKASR